MRVLTLFKKVINGFNFGAFLTSMILLLFMAISIFYGVMMRYIFNVPIQWVVEINGYMLVAVTLLSMSYVLRIDGHIRVDILDKYWNVVMEKALKIISYICIFIFSIVFVTKGWDMVIRSFINNWKSSTLLATPLFIPQSLIPLGGLMLLSQSLLLVIETTFEKTGSKDQTDKNMQH